MTPEEAVDHFPGVAGAGRATPLPGGHIHQSWSIGRPGRRWVVQACNTNVFPDLDAVMGNVTVLCAEIFPELAPLRTGDGNTLWRDRTGQTWRVSPFIEGTVPADGRVDPDGVFELGRGLGRFHVSASGFDAGRLAITLPGFHDPQARLAFLDRMKIDSDDVRRLDPFRHLALEAATFRTPGVAIRVAHFDAKADNFLLDDRGRVRAVIDLDTVMPGSWLWDFGDLARSTTGTANEDEPGAMQFDPHRYAALVSGYRSEVDPVLSTEERGLLSMAPFVVTFEQAVRFLTDHYAGDTYYRVARPGHNLDRALAQLALLDSMTAHQSAMIGGS